MKTLPSDERSGSQHVAAPADPTSAEAQSEGAEQQECEDCGLTNGHRDGCHGAAADYACTPPLEAQSEAAQPTGNGMWVNVAGLNDGEIWDWCREMYGSQQDGAAAFRKYAADRLAHPVGGDDHLWQGN